MAVFRDGVKVGNFDMRVGLEKSRMQAMIKKLTGIGPDKPSIPDNKGQLDAIRSVVAKSEGFLKPNQFSIMFNMPKGVSQIGKTAPKGLEKETVIMNKSLNRDFQNSWNNVS